MKRVQKKKACIENQMKIIDNLRNTINFLLHHEN